MKKLVAIAVAAWLVVPLPATAQITPEELECMNIERTHNDLERSLRIHLERGAPRKIDIDYDRLIKLLMIPADWFAESVNATWYSSLEAYENDIRTMRARGRAHGCEWAQEV